MSTRDLSVLNDKEFENLSIDLLRAEYGVPIERFKPGRDLGIDGRFYKRNGDGTAIIQCKHYLGSGYGQLRKNLDLIERHKLPCLAPDRYILVTSVPLSPANKATLESLLKPYIVSTADILGSDEISGLLDLHPDVERIHYKLWIHSTNVLTSVLHNDVTGRSQTRIEEFLEFQSKYVVTTFHRSAIDRLDNTNVLILTGEPGIGKTTLAEALTFTYAANGFEPIFVEESCAEAERLLMPEQRQIVYFDDFLGSNFLSALRKDSDTHIMNLIGRISRDPSKRLILTSRTNIFQQAHRLSDRFRDRNIDKDEQVLILDDLDELDKARILYNHIWFSRLDPEFVDQLYIDKRYRKVIKHDNFNPRLISFITDLEKIRGIQADQYWHYIENALDNPSDVWRQTFDAQLDDAGRALVTMVVLNGGEIDESTLEMAYRRQLRAGSITASGSLRLDFGPNVRAITRAFVNRNHDISKHIVWYEVFSPSLSDFVLNDCSDNSDRIISIVDSLRTRDSIIVLLSIRKSGILGESRYGGIIEELVRLVDHDYLDYPDYAVSLWSAYCRLDGASESHIVAICADIQAICVQELSNETIRSFLVVCGVAKSRNAIDNPSEFAVAITSSLDLGSLNIDQMSLLTELLASCNAQLEPNVADELELATHWLLVEWAETRAREVDLPYREEEHALGYHYFSLADHLFEACKDELEEEVHRFMGFVSMATTEQILADVDFDEIASELEKEAFGEDHSIEHGMASYSPPYREDAIDDLFDRSE